MTFETEICRKIRNELFSIDGLISTIESDFDFLDGLVNDGVELTEKQENIYRYIKRLRVFYTD